MEAQSQTNPVYSTEEANIAQANATSAATELVNASSELADTAISELAKVEAKLAEANAKLAEANSMLASANSMLAKSDFERHYLRATINIYNNSHNKGEKDEVLLLLNIFYLNHTQNFHKLVDMFGCDASEGVILIDMNTRIPITDITKLGKAPASFKADCSILLVKPDTVYNASIKSLQCANPAIMNHTPRTAKVFQSTGHLSKCVNSLDVVLQEYISKRGAKTIGEDIHLCKLDCLQDNLIRSDVKEVLSYFLFDGTGKGDSKCKANAMMLYNNNNIEFVKCCDLEQKKMYVETILEQCIVSLRDKGMPTTVGEECMPWVFNDTKADGSIKYKGSLHIRLK